MFVFEPDDPRLVVAVLVSEIYAVGTNATHGRLALERQGRADLEKLVATSTVIAVVAGWARSNHDGRHYALARGDVVYLRDRRRQPALRDDGQRELAIQARPDESFVTHDMIRFPWLSIVFLRQTGPQERFLTFTDPAACCLLATPRLVSRVKYDIQQQPPRPRSRD